MSEELTGTFKLPTKTAVLRFLDTDYKGAEVRVLLTVPMAKLIEFMGAIEDDKLVSMMEGFGEDIVLEWNLVDEKGVPIPATGEGLKANVDPLFFNLLGQQWVEVMTNPPDPLFEPSKNGESEAEASIPMESVSISPPS